MSYENPGDLDGNNGGGASGNGAATPQAAGPETQGARLQVVGQYVKDLSFENPGAGMSDIKSRPQIDLGVDLQAGRVEGDRFEVELKLRVSAKADERAIFLLELIYCGVFMVENVPEEVLQQVLLVEGPHLLFPFARRVVADVIRDGGMPPLMIEPIDFNALYQAKAAEGAAQRAGAQR
ncbi:MAG TPA: protein-export chaperone SecB [Rhizomicrobium sp.]|nr:protein-export chaperone SecB [Rhizomicrobium sp.]